MYVTACAVGTDTQIIRIINMCRISESVINDIRLMTDIYCLCDNGDSKTLTCTVEKKC